MKLLIKIYLIAMLGLSMSCSKTNMQLVPAEKDVVLESRMMDNEAATLLLAATTKEERLGAISKIDRTASANFNWEFFWKKLGEQNFLERVGSEEQNKLYELSYRSCLSEAQVSFLNFAARSSTFTPLLEVIKRNNCESINVPASNLLEIVVRLSKANLNSLANVWSLTKYKIKNGQEYWSGLEGMNLENLQGKVDLLLRLGMKNVYSEEEQLSFYRLYKNKLKQDASSHQFIKDAWKKGGLQIVDFNVFENADANDFLLAVDLIKAWKKCGSKTVCFNKVDFNEWLETVSSEFLKFNEDQSVVVDEMVLQTIELSSNYCSQTRLDKVVSLILDDRVKRYDLIEKINCNLELSLDELNIVFEKYKEAFERATGPGEKKNITISIAGYFFRNNIFNGNRSWFQSHFNKYISTWKEMSEVLAEEVGDDMIKWVLYLQSVGGSSFSLVHYNEQLFVNKLLKTGADIGQLIRSKRIETQDILRFLSKTTLTKVTSHSTELERKKIWKNLEAAVYQGVDIQKNVEQAWSIKMELNQILKDYVELNHSSLKIPTLNDVLVMKNTTLHKIQNKYVNTNGYEHFLMQNPMDLDANFLLMKLKDKISGINEVGKNYHIDFETASDRFFSMAKLDRIDSLKILLRLSTNRDDYNDVYSEYCQHVGSIKKIPTQRSGEDIYFESEKIDGPHCYELAYELVEKRLKTTLKLSRARISDYTVVKTFGASLSLVGGTTEQGHFDLTQEYVYPKAKRAEKTTAYDGWSLPMHIVFQMQKSVSISKNGYLINLKTGDYVVFRYHHVKKAEKGPMYIEPKIGLPAGNLELHRSPNKFVPTLVAFGGIGQEAGEASHGGEAVSSEVSSEERYNSTETKYIVDNISESCYADSDDDLACEDIRPHFMNDVRYEFFSNFIAEYVSQTGQVNFFKSVKAFKVENESSRTKLDAFCEEYLQKRIQADGDDTDLSEYTIINGGRVQNCKIYVERRIEDDLKSIAERQPDGSSNVDYLIPELSHRFRVESAAAGDVLSNQYAESGQAGAVKNGAEL